MVRCQKPCHWKVEDILTTFFNRRTGAIAAATLLTLLPPAASLGAAPTLRCQIDQGGITRVIESSPTDNPYRVAAIDINGRFRFKAVVIGDAQHIDYIKLYVYDQAKRQPALLHVASYLSPETAFSTGVNAVYAPYLEREMQYQCSLLPVAP